MRRESARVAGARARPRAVTLVSIATASLVLAGCSGYSGGVDHQVRQWAAGANVTTNDGYVTADLQGIDAGISRGELGATRTACDGLASDAASAYGELPTPEPALTHALDEAYLTYVRAAEACSSTRSFSGPSFRGYSTRVAVANSWLARADTLLRAAGVR